MSVKFLGQFLIEQGEIDAGQLREALDYMATHNVELGMLAVRHGHLTVEDTRRVQQRQRRRDATFGEIAVELGLLASTQVEKLLAEQQRSRVKLGEALVALGHLRAERLGALVDAFKSDQSRYERSSGTPLPPELADLEVAVLCVDLVVKLAFRLSRLHVKVAEPDGFVAEARPRWSASLWIRGDQPLGLWLMAEPELAACFAGGVTRVDATSPRALVEDALGEFLNLVAGNAIALLEQKGIRAQLEPPRFGVPAPDGSVLSLVTPTGRGTLVLVR